MIRSVSTSNDQLVLQDYKDHMEPLVLEECASLLLRGDDDGATLKAARAIMTGTIQASALHRYAT